MKNIIKIVIKSSSGYCHVDEAYNDKIIITPEYIEYEYFPIQKSNINTIRQWKYKTNSPIFTMKYEQIIKLLPSAISLNINEMCTDVGEIEFDITYSDKTKFKKAYFLPGYIFKDLFCVIKSMVPKFEYIPAVLLTEDDYKQE